MIRFVATTTSGKEYELPCIKRFRFYSDEAAPADLLIFVAIVDSRLFEFAFVRIFVDKKLFFDGVVDEQVTKQCNNNFELKIVARNRTAILLDNQAKPGLYKNVSLTEIFERHVKCHGFKEMLTDGNPKLESLLVKIRASEWHVLELFCKRAMGILPRISADGVLDVRKKVPGKLLNFKNTGGGQIYSSVSVTNRRYGAVSSVYVKGQNHEYGVCVPNLKAIGHETQIKRYIETPREYSGDGLKYAQEYIEKKNRNSFVVDILAPGIVEVRVGDVVNFEGEKLHFEGLTVSGVEHEMSEKQIVTKVRAYRERG
ncbi:hypothetical protein FACS1894198_6730 [Clostridia bacterium]|nr:hypothetical protein FACS1894198_6730 [Clostridia bacterium]